MPPHTSLSTCLNQIGLHHTHLLGRNDVQTVNLIGRSQIFHQIRAHKPVDSRYQYLHIKQKLTLSQATEGRNDNQMTLALNGNHA